MPFIRPFSSNPRGPGDPKEEEIDVPERFVKLRNSVVPLEEDRPWIKGTPETANAYKAMTHYADNMDSDVSAYSGFRTYTRQYHMWKHFWDTYDPERGEGKNLQGDWVPAVASPGKSAHNFGTAIDFNIPVGSWRDDERYHWMKEHAPGFGFEQTHSGEGWHWVYNPEKDRMTDMYNKIQALGRAGVGARKANKTKTKSNKEPHRYVLSKSTGTGHTMESETSKKENDIMSSSSMIRKRPGDSTRKPRRNIHTTSSFLSTMPKFEGGGFVDPIPNIPIGVKPNFTFGGNFFAKNINNVVGITGFAGGVGAGPWEVGGKAVVPRWRSSAIGNYLSQRDGGEFQFGEGEYTLGAKRWLNDRLQLGAGLKYDAKKDKLSPKMYATYKFEDGGYVGKQDPVDRLPKFPIQAEKGEKIIFPNLSITPVKANKTHKQMDDDEITDIVPFMSYIASAQTKIKKEDADNIVIGREPAKYKHGAHRKKLKVSTLGDVFGSKKEYTPAQITNRIKKKYPITERENDIFARRAKRENRSSRMPYIGAMISLAEDGDIAGEEEINKMRESKGKLKESKGSVPKFGEGGFSDFIPGVVQAGLGAWQMIRQGKRRKEMQKAYDRLIGEAGDVYDTKRDYLGQGSLASAVGVMAQDPTYDAPDLDFSDVRALKEEIPQSVFDYYNSQARRTLAGNRDALYSNTSRFGQAAAFDRANIGSVLNSASNLAAKRAEMNVGLYNQKRRALADLSNRQEMLDTQAANQTRSNQNRQIGQFAGVTSNYYNNMGMLEGEEFRTKANLTAQKHGNEAIYDQNQFNAAALTGYGLNQAFQGAQNAGWFQGQQNTNPTFNNLGGSFNLGGPTSILDGYNVGANMMNPTYSPPAGGPGRYNMFGQ